MSRLLFNDRPSTFQNHYLYFTFLQKLKVLYFCTNAIFCKKIDPEVIFLPKVWQMADSAIC